MVARVAQPVRQHHPAGSIQKFPRVRSIEAANAHGFEELWLEVIEVDAMSCAELFRQRFPMRDDAARFAADRAEGSVSLDVVDSVLRMTFYRDRAELVVRPDRPETTADRAVASVAASGMNGKVSLTAPQWQEPSSEDDDCFCMVGRTRTLRLARTPWRGCFGLALDTNRRVALVSGRSEPLQTRLREPEDAQRITRPKRGDPRDDVQRDTAKVAGEIVLA